MGFIVGDILAQRLTGEAFDAVRSLELGLYGTLLGMQSLLWIYLQLDKGKPWSISSLSRRPNSLDSFLSFLEATCNTTHSMQMERFRRSALVNTAVSVQTYVDAAVDTVLSASLQMGPSRQCSTRQ